MPLSPPHNENASYYFDPVQVLQLLEAAGGFRLPDGAVFRGCRVEAGRIQFDVSYCDPERRVVLGHDIRQAIDDIRDAEAAVDRGMSRLRADLDLKRSLEDRGLLPPPDLNSTLEKLGIDFAEETRQLREEQRFQAEAQARLQEEMTQADPLPPPEQAPDEPPPEGVTPGEKFGRVAHAVHTDNLAARVKAVYDEAHEPDRRLFTDRAAVLETARGTFKVPFLETDTEATIRWRTEMWLKDWPVTPVEAAMVRATLDYWLEGRQAVPHTAKVETADDQWFPLDPKTKR